MIVKEVYFENINVPIVINYTQGTNDIPIRFKFMDIKLSTSQRVFLYANKVSGNKIYNEAEEVNINEGYVDFAVTTQMSAEAGRNVMQLRITEHENVVNSFPILFDVASGVYDEDAILSSNEYKALDQALDSAREWENAAEASAAEAKKYSDNAGVYATNARISELNAKTHETNAKTSEANAKTSEANAKVSETNAKVSETNASASASAASTSATNAKVSETNASSSASSASTSASNAMTSETNASASASAASASSASAKEYADSAYTSANNAAKSEETALSHASTAVESVELANASKDSAKTSEDNARAHALMSESYAVGTGGIREGEATDNASYYYRRSKEIYENFQSSGTVTGVKGNTETNYRAGNVNITPENIGLGNVPNVTTNNQTPTYTVASSLSELTSGEKISVAFGKIAKAISSLISHISTTATTSVLGHVMVDSALSSTSTNPVQNKVVNAALDDKNNIALAESLGWKKANITTEKWENLSSNNLYVAEIPKSDFSVDDLYLVKLNNGSVYKVVPKGTTYYGISNSQLLLGQDIDFANSGNITGSTSIGKKAFYTDATCWYGTKGAPIVISESQDVIAWYCRMSGTVKELISNSSVITATGTYALDAVEKNASVEGTLANRLHALGNVVTLGTMNASGTVGDVVIGNIEDFSNYRYIIILAMADDFCDYKVIPVPLILVHPDGGSRGCYLKIYALSSFYWEGNVGFESNTSIRVYTIGVSGWGGAIISIYGIK